VVLKPTVISDAQLAESKRAIYATVQRRTSTDKVLSYLWIIVPIVISFGIIAAWAVYAIATFPIYDSGYADPSELEGMLTAMIVIIFPAEIVASLVLAVLAYQLVKRQNDHFARERELREGIVSMIRAAAGSAEREQLLARELGGMWFAHRAQEEEHNPMLWGVVIALPTALIALAGVLMWAMVMEPLEDVVGAILIAFVVLLVVNIVYMILQFYMFYFLGKNMFEHDGRWNTFIHQARLGMSRLAFPGGRPYHVSRLPERSFIIYLVVAIFISIFIWYWWYALIKDPNEHFRSQWEFEDHVLSVIAQPPPFTSSASRQ